MESTYSYFLLLCSNMHTNLCIDQRNTRKPNPMWPAGVIVSVLLAIQATAVPHKHELPSSRHHAQPLKTNISYNIAHRGSSGEFPEETAPAYKRAIEEGASFIESDISATKDGALICFHDPTLDEITNIANHPEFAHRRRTYQVEGVNVTGFFTVDFTVAELKTLRVRQRWSFRDQSFNDQYEIITFEEFIAIALNADRVVGIYPEIKSPVFVNQHVKWPHGNTYEDVFVATLLKYGYKGKYLSRQWLEQPVFIQSFAPSSLLRVANQTDSPKMLNVGDLTSFTQDTNQSYAELMSDEYLDFISKYVVGVGPSKDTVVPASGNKLLPATDLVDRAHARGLQVHVATFRNENCFLHSDFHQDPYEEYDFWIKRMGVDGLFTDFPKSLSNYQKHAGAFHFSMNF